MKKFFTLFVTAITAINLHALQLTVANGTKTDEKVPVYGTYADYSQRCQLIYPATMLSFMTGYQITGLTFYIQDYLPGKAWSGYEIYLSEVTASSFASENWNTETAGELVYSGNLDGTSGSLVIELDKPYDYKGGNLLVDFRHDKQGGYAKATFLGISQSTIAGVSTNKDVPSYTELTEPAARYFLPKLTFTYDLAAACPKPTAVRLTITTSTSASFAWKAGGEEAQWQYTYAKGSAAPDWNTAKSTSSAGASLSGLDPQTDYTFYVRAYCSAESQSDAVSIAFTTDCAPLATLPWSEGFESYEDHSALPACWKAESNNDLEIDTYAGLAHGGSNYLLLKGGAPTTSQIIMLPEFEEPIKNLTLSFYYSAFYYAYSKYGYLMVGYIIEKDGEEGFQAVDMFERTTDYTPVKLDFKDTPLQATRIAFCLYGGEEDGQFYMDDFKVTKSDATALYHATAPVQALKRVENGQIVIIKNDVKYNVLGSQLTK